jgi:hypothetical protein
MNSDRHAAGAAARPDDNTRRIEADIEHTRADINDTLHRLQDKISPGQLMDQALDYVRGGQVGKAGGEFASNLASVVRGNPVPLALIGIGIAWLAVSSAVGMSKDAGAGNGHRPATGPRVGDKGYGAPTDGVRDDAADHRETGHDGPGLLQSAQAGISQAADGVRDKLGQIGDSVHDTMGGLTAQAGDAFRSASGAVGRQADRVQHGVQSIMRDQPLVIAGVGLAVGAALGAALPGTEVENRLVGEARDGVVDEAKALGRQQLDRAQESLGKVGEAMKGVGTEVKDGLRQVTQQVRDSVGEAGKSPAKTAGQPDPKES